MGLLGIFSKFKKKDTPEADTVQLPPLPQPVKMQQPETPVVQQPVNDSDTIRLKIELLLSEIDSLRTQMEMINERLKIIERKIDQKGTIRYV